MHKYFILVGLFCIHLSSNVDIYSLYGGTLYGGTFALLDCVRYNEDFVKLGFFSIHSPVILARQKKIVRYTEDFVIERFVISRFQCTMTH